MKKLISLLVLSVCSAYAKERFLDQQDNIVDAPNPERDDLEQVEEYSAIDDKVTRIFTDPNVTISFD